MKALQGISVFFICVGLYAQEQKRTDLFVSADISYGSIIPEYQFVHALVKTNIQQVELSIFKQTQGSNYWQKLYAYPSFGLSAFFTTLGNKTVLGDELALFPFVCFNSSSDKKLHFRNKIGLGLGYSSKRFDLEDNYQNIAVGSHLNIHFAYQTGVQYDFNAKSHLKFGLNFNHFSNANMKEPNLGINTLSLSFGWNQAISQISERKKLEIPKYTSSNEFAFVYGIGGKHTRALQSDVFVTTSFSFEYRRKLGHILGLGVGADLFYDASTATEMSVYPDKNYHKSDNFTSGIHLSQEIAYNHFSFILQEGFYLGLKEKVNESIMYNRAILRYKWSQHFFMQIAMKSRLHILDYPEVGFSYYFKQG